MGEGDTMIYLFSGTPGSGKSLHQARIIRDRLRAGKPVLANFYFDTSRIKHCRGEFYEYDNLDLSPALLMNYSSKYFENHKFREGAIWLFIDEAQLLFNAREWQATGRSEWTKFFTQHRKFGYDIFLIAQFDRMLDRQLRSLIEYEYIHRKVSNYGIPGKLISLFSGGSLFVSVKMWYPLREKVGSEWFHYRPSLGKLYNSYKMFEEKQALS